MLSVIINFIESLMRTLFSVFILVSLLSGCASVEPSVQQGEEDVSADENASVPEWFNPLKTSFSDSAAVYSFSLASATDSSEAVLLAEKSALGNLRNEIDNMVENTREKLVDNGNSDTYSEASFIIKLRNTVRDLPLSNTTFVIESYRTESDIYHVYAKASLSKNSLWDILSDRLNNPEFMNAFKS